MTELEKEAEEYIKKNYVLYSISGNDIDLMTQAYLASAEPREKRIEELEKENKTLRIHQTNAVLEGLEMEVLKNSHRDRANNLQDQLTKAKEIIRKLIEAIHIWDCKNLEEVETEAEQFISEAEK